jgi:glycosyltransferase involved in cell wall biosynthesis
MKLSILICTIPERINKFNTLLEKLNLQSSNLETEILFDNSPKGTITIGGKRNNLLNKAKGEYVVFIDDDDDVSNEYISELINAIEKNPDCIGFQIACDIDGKKYSAASSMKYDWKEDVDGYKYVRSIYHKTPVKREISLKCMFPDKSFGEDYEYSIRLKQHLKSEIFINKVLYYYNFKYEDPKTKYGISVNSRVGNSNSSKKIQIYNFNK